MVTAATPPRLANDPTRNGCKQPRGEGVDPDENACLGVECVRLPELGFQALLCLALHKLDPLGHVRGAIHEIRLPVGSDIDGPDLIRPSQA